MLATVVIVIGCLALIFLYTSIRVLREYERGVVFTLGRYTGTKGPGLFLLVPFIQQMVRVDLRVNVDEVPQAMQLRYLGTLFDIASERGSTIVFPFPIELVEAFKAMAPKP